MYRKFVFSPPACPSQVVWSEFGKECVCLDAIDSGVIARGRPMAVVDAIFGTSYAKKLPLGAHLRLA